MSNQNEFRQQLIVACIQGLSSNNAMWEPSSYRYISNTAIELADDVILALESRNMTEKDGKKS